MKWNVTSDVQDALDRADVRDIEEMGDRLIRTADRIADSGPTGPEWHKENLYREIGHWLEEIAELRK